MSLPNNLSKKEIREQLWRLGELSWLLDKNQKELRDLFYNSPHKVQTWLLARRSGKTYCLCVLALEQCIRKPGSIVKFLSPTKMQVATNVRPIFKQVLLQCPNDIKPDFDKARYIYHFPNGSEIQLAGTDNGHAEKLRGGDSDISIVDEAGSCSDLSDIVKSILLPTTLITNGKVLLASTPPKQSDHDFLKFIEQSEHRGSLIKKTIYDNPRITQEQIQELMDELGGPTTDAARRELFCEILRDSATTVIPEFTEALEKEVVQEWTMPPYYNSYVSMDLGGIDLTVVLFAYFDFRTDKVIVQDELVLDFSKENVNIKTLSEEILKKEQALWTNKITQEITEPQRVSDINYIAIKEIREWSGYKINFQPAKKDEKETALNVLRVMIGGKKVIIDPRCTTLIKHLKNVKWAGNQKKTFARSPDMGHYDAVDALLYMVRSINYKKNPYPANYDLSLKAGDAFAAYVNPFKSPNIEIYKKIFNVRK